MNTKDRERLALSTGLALAGYALLFLLLTGLDWPSVAPFHSISPPVSVYVNLSGGGTALASHAGTTEVKQAATKGNAAPAVETKKSAGQPPASKTSPPGATAEPAKQDTSPASQPAASTPSQPAVQPSPPAQPMPTTQEATVIPPSTLARPQAGSSTRPSTTRPPTPAGSMSAGGTASSGGVSPTPSTAVGKPTPAIAGSPSPKPGVTYPPNTQPAPVPPTGSGGAAPSELSGQSKTYFGATPSGSGEFFNPKLAQSAGSGSSAPSSAGSTSGGGSSVAGSIPPSAATAGSGGGAASATAGGGPTIVWKDSSSARQVEFEPKPLVIPKRLLDVIPPAITLTITFRVLPSGTVNALNIVPSLGYPELDTLLENWMEKWRFQSVPGDQSAQGKLKYVIQAVTAR